MKSELQAKATAWAWKRVGIWAVTALLALSARAGTQEQRPALTEQEKQIAATMGTLRKLPEAERAKKTKELRPRDTRSADLGQSAQSAAGVGAGGTFYRR